MSKIKRLFEDVQELIMDGYSNEEISDALNVGEFQVEAVRLEVLGDEE